MKQSFNTQKCQTDENNKLKRNEASSNEQANMTLSTEKKKKKINEVKQFPHQMKKVKINLSLNLIFLVFIPTIRMVPPF